ncbi:MAG TPA: NAD(P)/FAD-dependent oxidoreductase [Clostridia bacterium]|nr:NAD(P)/FAD-dependent oxidoreductase [Clostridia bacterium]
MDTKIVVVGAGYAGVLTAKKLAKRFAKSNDIKITIIDKNPFHTMLTELHEVAASRVDEDSIKISLKRVFAGRRVDVKQDTVDSIDFEKKQVIGKKEQYAYDYLVLSAGSKPTYFGVPGAHENAFKLWSYEDAVVLKDHIHEVFRKAAVETDMAERKRLLTFHIVGAGFTGVELVGEIAEYVPILCDKYELDPGLVSIADIDVLPRTVPVLPEKLSAKVERRLNNMGVRVLLNTGVVNIGKDFIEFKKDDVVTREASGTIVWAAGIEASDITAKAAQKLESANRGRIKTDKYLRSLNDDHVFIAGDNMLYTPEGEKMPVPQVVENCEQSSDTVSHNIICSVTGKGEMEEYKPAFHGVMVSIGGRYGVAHVGMPNRKFSLPSFLAMFAKHFINVIYYIQVLGWNKVFSYLMHEFFTIRNKRSFVGGHLSNRTPSFLLMPLRVWLGLVWLFEGIMKIVEGWFVAPKLTGFFSGARGWYNNILNGAAGGGATDGTSSATTTAAHAAGTVIKLAADAVSSATNAAGGSADAAASAAAGFGTTIMNFDFLGLFHVIFVSGKPLASSSISDYAFMLDVPFVNWIVGKFVLPYNGMQMFMQIAIVIAEILIGLALIGGLFTTPAAAASLILQAMFVTTTGLYLSSFWMIFAGIAMLIAAGRVLGLDYWVMPVLKEKWKHVKWVRKWYLYND